MNSIFFKICEVYTPKDNRRMFTNEFTLYEQKKTLDWLNENKSLTISDILKGRGIFSA